MIPDLVTGYDIPLVMLSVAIAILASYTTLNLAGRVTATEGRSQLGWLASGAVTLGMGIWSMHFIGMLAFRLPLAVHYGFRTVLISILPAVIAAGLALLSMSRPGWGWGRFLGSGLCLGVGIAAMHYLGMAAMETTAVMVYDWPLVVVSIVIAIAVSLGGLFLVFRLRDEANTDQRWQQPLAALVMGAAIPTMHYIGMAAVQFIPTADTRRATELQAPDNALPLAIAVVIGISIILSLALLTAFFDRRLAAQVIYTQALKDSQRYLKTVLKGIQVGVLVIKDGTDIALANPAVLGLLQVSTEAELRQLWEQTVCPSVATDATELANGGWSQALLSILQRVAAQQPVKNAVVQIADAEPSEMSSLLVNGDIVKSGVRDKIKQPSDALQYRRSSQSVAHL
jgi:NO-binding membrane sensor protein with MHYT domain